MGIERERSLRAPGFDRDVWDCDGVHGTWSPDHALRRARNRAPTAPDLGRAFAPETRLEDRPRSRPEVRLVRARPFADLTSIGRSPPSRLRGVVVDARANQEAPRPCGARSSPRCTAAWPRLLSFARAAPPPPRGLPVPRRDDERGLDALPRPQRAQRPLRERREEDRLDLGLVRLVRVRDFADHVDRRAVGVPEGRVCARANQEADDLDTAHVRRYGQRRGPFVVRQVDVRARANQ